MKFFKFSVSFLVLACSQQEVEKVQPNSAYVGVSENAVSLGDASESNQSGLSSGVKVKELKIINQEKYRENIILSNEDLDYQYKTSTFVQSAESLPLLDILIVVDNSGSMYEEQANLSTKLSALLSNISNIDWQINIITTDTACPVHAKLPINSKMDPDEAEKLFLDAVNVGTNGSWMERGILMAVSNLSGRAAGECGGRAPPQWLRDKSKIAVIFVTDENEQKSGSEPEYSKIELIKVFEELGRKPGEEAKAYGLLNLPKESEACAFPSEESKVYMDAISTLNGFYGNICASDYSKILGEISLDVSFLVQLKVQLAGVPVLSTLSVSVDQGPFLDWSLVGDSIALSKPLEAGQALVATYKTKVARELKLQYLPTPPNSIEVTIQKKTLEAEAYRYLARDNLLLFNEELPLGEEISVSYNLNKKENLNFEFPKVQDGNIECYVDNVKIDTHYSQSLSILRIDSPVALGSTAYCLYR
ncbi:MAG: VWA domain-containing protein [Oligoflexales bacterium]|nr:VWA domain-containing protein [Oligoflexales bacterium]